MAQAAVRQGRDQLAIRGQQRFSAALIGRDAQGKVDEDPPGVRRVYTYRGLPKLGLSLSGHCTP